MGEAPAAWLADEEVEQRLRRIDDILATISQTGTPESELALGAVAALSEVYGAALARLLRLAGGAARLAPALGRDELLRHLLLLHDLSPRPDEAPAPSGAPDRAAQAGGPAFVPVTAVGRRPAPDGGAGDRCELCAGRVPRAHRHLVDLESAALACVCPACAVLFGRGEAGAGRYRLVPDRRRRLPALSPASLGVPVGLAFFVRNEDGTVAAHYPSPAGATRWELDPQRWEAAARDCPELAELAPAVEAVLVNTASGQSQAWLVPIDDCYRLVAVVREHWTGISGGERVWPQIDLFFRELRGRDGTDPGR